MLRLGKTWRQILIESALIIFSILFALGVNEWAASRSDTARARRALEAVSREIVSNEERLVAVLPYHRRLAAAAERADSLGRVHSLAEWRAAVPEFKGFHNPDLDATAWQSALTTGAMASLPFDTVAALSRVYTYQLKLDAYAATSIPTFDFSDQAMRATSRKAYIYLATVLANEDSLAKQYASARKLLGAAPAEPRP